MDSLEDLVSYVEIPCVYRSPSKERVRCLKTIPTLRTRALRCFQE